jgi:flagellar basal-body rod protein FlgF
MFETTQDPETVQRPAIMQGMMEESNVQPVVEITKMTEILRQYQGVQKMIENENDRQIKAMTVLSAVKQA